MIQYLLRGEHFGGLLKNLASGVVQYLDPACFAAWAGRPDVRLVGTTRAPEDCLSAPMSVAISLTNRCSLRCKHCYTEAGERIVAEMPPQRLADLVLECCELGVFELRFTGGEPTLREDLFSLAAVARGRGATAALLSNGIWTDEMCARVLESALDRFYISLEGIESTNDEIRGEGSYRKALCSLRRLAAAGKRTCLSVHLRRSNIREIQPLIDLASELDMLIKFSPLRPVGRAGEQLEGEIPRAVEMRAAVGAVNAARRDNPKARIFIDFDLESAETLVPSPLFDCRGCHAARRMVGIDSAGRVYPCTFLWQGPGFIAGDLSKQTLAEVWLQSTALRAFRDAPRHDMCSRCAHFGVRCLGGCPAVAFHSSGNISGMDPCCYMAAMDATQLE